MKLCYVFIFSEQPPVAGVCLSMNSRRFIITAFLVLSWPFTLLGQEAPRPTPNQATRTQLDPIGGVDLPIGFRYTRTKNWADAWFGTIHSEKQKLVINFGAGLVGPPSPDARGKLIWQETINVKVYEDRDPLPVQISLFNVRKKERIFAVVGRAQFSADVYDASEQEVFISIVSSYRDLASAIRPA